MRGSGGGATELQRPLRPSRTEDAHTRYALTLSAFYRLPSHTTLNACARTQASAATQQQQQPLAAGGGGDGGIDLGPLAQGLDAIAEAEAAEAAVRAATEGVAAMDESGGGGTGGLGGAGVATAESAALAESGGAMGATHVWQ